MRDLVNAAQLDPLTRETALTLLARWRPRSAGDGVHRIRSWVRRHMRYVNEPVEILHGAAWMLGQIQQNGFVFGDCDDAAILAGTLGTALGLPARFVAVRPPAANEFLHVFVEFSDPTGHWFMCDPTASMPPPAGWERLELAI